MFSSGMDAHAMKRNLGTGGSQVALKHWASFSIMD